MAVPSSAYPQNGTPQMNQMNNGQPNATNTQAPPGGGVPANPQWNGDPSTLNAAINQYGSDPQLNQRLNEANANQIQNNLPSTRQAVVANSNLPSMQSNYEDLAKQLFQYDQGTLAPQFQGTNPGMPSDALSFGSDVPASPLAMTVQGAGLPANQGLYAGNNPKEAYAAQIGQGATIADLLKVLNTSQATEYGSKTGVYDQSQKAKADAVQLVLNAMQGKSTLVQKAAELEAAKNKTAADNSNARTLEGIKLGVIDPSTGLPWASGKGSQGTPQSYADSFMGGFTKWADIPDELKPAITNLVKKEGGKVQTIIDGYQSLDNSSSIINDIFNKWSSLSEMEKIIPSQLLTIIPGLSATRSGMNTQFINSLEPELRKAVAGGRITQQEFQWIKNSIIPTATDTYESALAKINAVKEGIALKRQNPSYTIGTTTLQSGNNQMITLTKNGKSISGPANSPNLQGLLQKGWAKQ